jgi:hypothetical protein
VPRFFVWAILLVAIAVATGAGGLSWWLIALVELSAWAAVTLAERTLWHVSLTSPAKGQRPATLAQQVPEAEPEPVAAPAVETSAPEPVLPPERSGARRMMRMPQSRAPVGVAERSGEQVRWNIWSLERLARDHPNAEELEFLVVSLRDFADSSGQLPADFDPLVRESFGDLLPG